MYLCEKVITYDYILTLMQSKIISYHDKKDFNHRVALYLNIKKSI